MSTDSLANEIAAAHKAPAAEQVAEALIKGLFRNDLNAVARLLARQTITAALNKWKDQVVGELERQLKAAKDETRDHMMRADELRLKVEMHEKGLNVRPVT